ncbi:hypothetical protein [Pararobbsia alpina]
MADRREVGTVGTRDARGVHALNALSYREMVPSGATPGVFPHGAP